MMNEEDGVRIDLLDLTQVERHVYMTFKEQMSSDPDSSAFDLEYDDVTWFRVSRQVGRYITYTGQLYAVVEGIGAVGPISASDPLHLGAVRVYKEGKHPNPRRFVDDVTVTIFPQDLLRAAVVTSASISYFVRGDRSNAARTLLRMAS